MILDKYAHMVPIPSRSGRLVAFVRANVLAIFGLGPKVLAFSRGSGLGPHREHGPHTDVPLPAGTVVLSRRPVDGDTLGPDTAVRMAPC